MRSVDLAMAVPLQRSVAFPGEPHTHGKGVAFIRTCPEAVLPVIDHPLASRREGFVARQGLNGSGVIVAPLEDQTSAAIAELDKSLDVAAHPHGRAASITDHNSSIHFSNQPRLDGKLSASGKAQDRLVGRLVVAGDQVSDTSLVLSAELRRSDTS